MIKSSSGVQMYEGVLDNDHQIHVQAMLDSEGRTDLYVVLPEPGQLQIDYDSPEIPQERFDKSLDLLAQAYLEVDGTTFIDIEIRPSKSGNRHALLTVPGIVFTAVERVAWQAVFGSDLQREGLSLVSISRGLKNPSLSIEVKDATVIKYKHFRNQ